MLTTFINGFIDLISAAESVREIGRAFDSAIGQFGYKNLVVIDATKPDEPFASSLLFTSHDTRREFTALNRQIPFLDHPVVRYALNNDRPCDVEDLRQEVGTEPKVWLEKFPPHLVGSRMALLPVHREGTLKLLVGASGPQANTSPPVRAALHTCAHILYDRMRLIDELSEQHSVLTKREAECLYWASKGKIDAEVGKILGIAARTVRFHIGNAKQKLNAETRIQAIANKVKR